MFALSGGGAFATAAPRYKTHFFFVLWKQKNGHNHFFRRVASLRLESRAWEGLLWPLMSIHKVELVLCCVLLCFVLLVFCFLKHLTQARFAGRSPRQSLAVFSNLLGIHHKGSSKLLPP